MFLGNIFKKYKQREYRLILVQELIEGLEIDPRQKNLYLESLEVLDEEGLDRFYKKLTSVIEIIEEDENKSTFQKQSQEVYKINSQEELEKIQEKNTLSLILESV